MIFSHLLFLFVRCKKPQLFVLSVAQTAKPWL